MRSKRSNEGELFIAAGPIGIPEGFNISVPGLLDCPIVAPNKQEEFPTYCCKHCHVTVVMNPLRTRARAYCLGCDHYICDRCEVARLVNGCNQIEKVFDEIMEDHARNLNLGEI